MTALDTQLKELVLVKAILWARGTNVTELEQEIKRLRKLQRRANVPAAA